MGKLQFDIKNLVTSIPGDASKDAQVPSVGAVRAALDAQKGKVVYYEGVEPEDTQLPTLAYFEEVDGYENGLYLGKEGIWSPVVPAFPAPVTYLTDANAYDWVNGDHPGEAALYTDGDNDTFLLVHDPNEGGDTAFAVQLTAKTFTAPEP